MTNKEDFNDNSKLSFYDYTEDFNFRLQNLEPNLSGLNSVITVVLFLVLLAVGWFHRSALDRSFFGFIIGIAVIFVIVTLVAFAFVSIRNIIIKNIPQISIFLVPLIGVAIYYVPYKIADLYEINKAIIVFGLVILLWLFSKIIIELIPLYLIETYNKNITIFFTVITLCIEPNQPDIKTLMLGYLLNLILLQINLDTKLEESQQEAEKLFEDILIGKQKKTYRNLLECYAKGGNKYKEKILSNKEFLEMVIEEDRKR